MPRRGRLAALVDRPWPVFALLLTSVTVAAWLGVSPSEADDQRRRARALLGDRGTPAQVEALVRDAATIGVPIDSMLRAQRRCVFEPQRRPSAGLLRAVVMAARAAGQDPETALVAAARAACQPR